MASHENHPTFPLKEPVDRAALDITVRSSHERDPALESRLAQLLDTAFPGFFEGRTYCKQLSGLRLLARSGDTLVGHVGLDHRVIRVGTRCVPIFGIVDLCVATAFRGRGIGRMLLDRAAALGQSAGAAFCCAFADDPHLYDMAGYATPAPAMIRWLAIEDRESVALLTRDMSGILRVRPLGTVTWPEGTIDLLGHLF